MTIKIKGFIELTETKNLNKILINIKDIRLVSENKIHFFNVFLEVTESYDEIINLMKNDE